MSDDQKTLGSKEKVMEGMQGKFKIVPIMVGSLSTSGESKYGKILAKYLEVRSLITIFIPSKL